MRIMSFAAAGLVAAVTAVFPPLDAGASHVPPRIVGPAGGVRVTTFGPVLVWDYEGETTIRQVHFQLVPYNGDGPGLDLLRGTRCCAQDQFPIPPPPDWYGMLPDITYSWRIRSSPSGAAIGLDDPSWSVWSHWASFRTPTANSLGLKAVRPLDGDVNGVRLPTLEWLSTRSDLFYFEVQLSADGAFNTNPATATASVYWNLVHGGATNPPNSWTVPPAAALEPGRQYFWRVRPRVQGDGAPVPWSNTWGFLVRP